MNNNIPTPEELKAYIDESVISVTGTYEQSASVLMGKYPFYYIFFRGIRKYMG